MVDVLSDINVLEDVIIAFQEGASDEKRAAIYALEKLLSQKQQLVEEFEQFCDK